MTPGDIYINASGRPINNNRRNPETVANVQLSGSEYRYELGFIPEGEYTLAFTCHALRDFPNSQQNAGTVAFSSRQNVTVRSGETAEINLD